MSTILIGDAPLEIQDPEALLRAIEDREIAKRAIAEHNKKRSREPPLTQAMIDACQRERLNERSVTFDGPPLTQAMIDGRDPDQFNERSRTINARMARLIRRGGFK